MHYAVAGRYCAGCRARACHVIMLVFEVYVNEVWHARNGIVARGGARSNLALTVRIWPLVRGSAAGPALAARADLPAVLPDRGRGLQVHRRRERPVHRGRAVDQTSWPGRPGPAARPVGPDRGPVQAPDEKTIRVVLDRLDPRALTRALLGPRPHGRRRSGGACYGQRAPLRGLSDNGTVVVVKELRGAVLTPLAVAMSLVSGNRRRACLR
jgi:hypothetical protein